MTPTLLDEIVGHDVIKLGRQEGQTIQITDLRLTWKAQGEDTGYQFAVYEMTLPPVVGIPLHNHAAQPATFLSVSNHHEIILNSGGTAVNINDSLPTDITPEVFEKFVRASAKTQVYVVGA